MNKTKEKLDITILNIDNLIENSKKSMRLMYQLKLCLIRRSQALDDVFWFDKIEPINKTKALKEYKELLINCWGKVGSMWEDIYLPHYRKEAIFHLRKQWEKDKEQIQNESKKTNEVSLT